MLDLADDIERPILVDRDGDLGVLDGRKWQGRVIFDSERDRKPTIAWESQPQPELVRRCLNVFRGGVRRFSIGRLSASGYDVGWSSSGRSSNLMRRRQSTAPTATPHQLRRPELTTLLTSFSSY